MINDDIISVVVSIVISALVAWSLHPLLRRLALRGDIVDIPNHRRLNTQSVPVLGGVGVFFGVIAAIAFVGSCLGVMVVDWILLLSMTLILMVGVVDDFSGISPVMKIVAQCAVLCMVVLWSGFYLEGLHGLWGIALLPDMLAMALTILAGVYIINAVNLIDGVDGLCSGYTIVLSLIYGILFWYAGDIRYAIFTFATIGALLPFICYNLSSGRNKMFLGDGGSMLLGLMIILFAVRLAQTVSPLLSSYTLSFILASLIVPLCDALRVIWQRIARGKSPFCADMTHLHHILIGCGWSHVATSIAVILLQLLVMAVWWICFHLCVDSALTFYIVAAAGLVATWTIPSIVHGRGDE